MTITFSEKFAKRSLEVLLLVALVLSVISLITSGPFYTFFLSQWLPSTLSGFSLEDGISLLAVDHEDNIPTWFSVSVLLLCSVLLAVITSVVSRAGRRFVLHWGGLSVIFAYLSCDELTSIHERTTDLMRSLFHTSGVLYYAWTIPFGALTVIFALVYLRFLFHLPPNFRLLFIVSGAIYVSGALGFELLKGLMATLSGQGSMSFELIETAAEFQEMAGAVLFLYALMRYTTYLQKYIHRDKRG